ncbi:glutamate-5-semialdehyde dehydrogenase [Candidatus Sumerlaeota bacterium]|nr:glutamate-5-semialdehyde dehydrogenase [Candidatus Sumerlaeota bacterium]
MNMDEMLTEMGKRARTASRALAVLPPAVKNAALEAMAAAFESHRAEIRAENAKDVAGAEEHGLTKAAVDRLRLDDKRILAMAGALRELIALPDPVGEIENVRTRPNGLRIGHMRSPIGVVGIIYESRPNVTADAGALCLKSGNAAILRGGSEAFHSNRILARLMNDAAAGAGAPDGAIQLIQTTDREAVGALLRADQYVDVIIPRGGKPLIERVTRDSIIPVIKHLDGNCTVYVDETANLDDAVRITVNSKTQRTGVCNAAETLLVHRNIADEFLPRIGKALQEKGVEIRGDASVMELVPGSVAATEQDWYEEYLDLIIAAKVVDSYEEAVEFINHYGSHHTETIVTNDHKRAMHFLRAIDSACVHINASTRFSDGGEYGLGAEIGISTNKLHARGPMGLRELTTAKWIVFGEGQVRE